MKYQSNVEQHFFNKSNWDFPTTQIPYIIVDNFPQLGFLTALRFLEWVGDNPNGVVSLPTGKTPEYFIKWTQHLLSQWDSTESETLRKNNGLFLNRKPDFLQLKFIQLDEFYPIDPNQHNSFYNYGMNYYLKGFGILEKNALLINCDEIPRSSGKTLSEIFPDYIVDLTLRVRSAKTTLEEMQQKTIFMVDQWCSDYEQKIRNLGGIGFFLGGIGPDGHIAFNVRGSDVNSTTRLTGTNFETQAAAATDLGGIEISKNRLVITIGLDTITANPNATAIIIAAGEAKALVVKGALENKIDNRYPASVLQRLENARFYLTNGAAIALEDSQRRAFENSSWDQVKRERSFIRLCESSNTFGTRITIDDMKNDPFCAQIPDLYNETPISLVKSFKQKIDRGISREDGEIFLHTGPHHDDILLGYLPHVIHLVRSPNNRNVFVNLTSGFTSVTNQYLRSVLLKTKEFIENDLIQMMEYSDFFDKGYNEKWDKDIYHYLDRIASKNEEGQKRGLSHRIVRALVGTYSLKSKDDTVKAIDTIVKYLDDCYDGEKNTKNVQKLKGMIREFEEELVWAHYGVKVADIRHARLGFYTGDIFTENPQRGRDVQPILEMLREVKPTVITLAMDPEGSGPDTHYKVLQTIAEAIRLWSKEHDTSQVRIWGYRNVWYRFDAAEADIIVPVSLNSMSVLQDTFMNCYLSQKDASFPSYELDGPFCDLTQKIWVEQHQLMELILGRDFWYENEHPRLRAAHGVIFIKELTVNAFLDTARRLEKSMEGQIN
ncbi:MAG: glucosamine-6-phosphate isomerase [Candidatus Marinimicrobia bacterium]|nr:glucosamine-6-phosphate isomerase [Candidatus Neomarinimicrobiota bacterium]